MNLDKIVRAITRSAECIESVDPSRVAVKTIGGLYDGASTCELDQLSIKTAASLIPEDSAYSRLAAALQIEVPPKECAFPGIHSFTQSAWRVRSRAPPPRPLWRSTRRSQTRLTVIIMVEARNTVFTLMNLPAFPDFSTAALSYMAQSLAGQVATLLKEDLARLGGSSIQPMLFDVKQAAIYLGRSEQSIQHLIADRTLPVVRHGRRVHLHRPDLDAFIELNKY